MISVIVEELSRQSNWRRAAKTMASFGTKAVWGEKWLSTETDFAYYLFIARSTGEEK
jgi:hypothetical protein